MEKYEIGQQLRYKKSKYICHIVKQDSHYALLKFKDGTKVYFSQRWIIRDFKKV